MRRVKIWAAMLGALLLTAACADTPTGPNPNAGNSGPSKYMLEPVIVVGHPQDPGCNPYTDLNFCQGSGGTCMTSTGPGTTDPELVYLNSCYGGGGGTGTPGGGGGSPGGGSPGAGDGGSIYNCDPATDPDCEKPLTTTDHTTITNALAAYVRPASEIPDTTARRQCADMLRQFNTSSSAGNVFRGGSNTTHYGAMYNDRIHFDPQYLDAAAGGDATAQREIANTALHEAAHTLGFDHPAGKTWVGTQDYYTDVPFNLLSPGPNSCIAY